MASSLSASPTPAKAMLSSVPKQPWYLNWQGWKRASVTITILLSIISLVLSAIASLTTASKENLRALTVTGLVVNAISIALSALTSLDWRTEVERNVSFARKMQNVVHFHDDEGKIVVQSDKLE